MKTVIAILLHVGADHGAHHAPASMILAAALVVVALLALAQSRAARKEVGP